MQNMAFEMFTKMLIIAGRDSQLLEMTPKVFKEAVEQRNDTV